MLRIPKQQALARWDNLPDVLKEALFSDQNTDLLVHVCENEHVPEDKIPDISGAAGLVLLGFIHPEELAREIQDRTGMNPQVAETIAKGIDIKIFRPLRAEIDKVYQPALPDKEPLRIVTEIQKFGPPSGLNPPGVQPKPGAAEVKITPPRPAAPSLSMSSPPSAMAGKPGLPPPVLIHEETKTEPLRSVPYFEASAADQKFKEIKITKPEAPKPAILEMGGATPYSSGSRETPRVPPGISPLQKPPQPPRVVNYETPLPARGPESLSAKIMRSEPPAPRPESPPAPPPAPQTNTPLAKEAAPPAGPSFPSVKTPPQVRITPPPLSLDKQEEPRLASPGVPSSLPAPHAPPVTLPVAPVTPPAAKIPPPSPLPRASVQPPPPAPPAAPPAHGPAPPLKPGDGMVIDLSSLGNRNNGSGGEINIKAPPPTGG